MEFEKLDFFDGIEIDQIWVYQKDPEGDRFKTIMLVTGLEPDESGLDCDVLLKNLSTEHALKLTKSELLKQMQRVS